jgi:ribonuclease HI
MSIFDGYSRTHTDGSKEDAAAAAVTESVVLVKRLPDHSSIFWAEARAILLALDVAEQSTYDRFVVLSDSLSCQQAIQNRKRSNMSILETVSRVHELIVRGKKVAFMWLTRHVGVGGNSAADLLYCACSNCMCVFPKFRDAVATLRIATTNSD